MNPIERERFYARMRPLQKAATSRDFERFWVEVNEAAAAVGRVWPVERGVAEKIFEVAWLDGGLWMVEKIERWRRSNDL